MINQETYSEYVERIEKAPVKSEEISILATDCELSLSTIFGVGVFYTEWISERVFSLGCLLVEERADGFFDIYIIVEKLAYKDKVKIQECCDHDAVIGFFDYVPTGIKPLKKS